MSVESASDRLTFLSSDEFGTTADYTLAAGGTTSDIAGILNNPFRDVDMGGGPSTADTSPTFVCRSADLPGGAAGGAAGDTVVIDGTTYRVIELQPDGAGMTTLILGAQ